MFWLEHSKNAGTSSRSGRASDFDRSYCVFAIVDIYAITGTPYFIIVERQIGIASATVILNSVLLIRNIASAIA